MTRVGGCSSADAIAVDAGHTGEVTIEIERHRNGDGGRYVVFVDGEPVGELDHLDRDGIRTFTHTGVRPSHGGQGLAARLVRRGLDDARADGVRVVGRCSYVADYLDRHPADHDLRA